jgi:hypothetical protein
MTSEPLLLLEALAAVCVGTSAASTNVLHTIGMMPANGYTHQPNSAGNLPSTLRGQNY